MDHIDQRILIDQSPELLKASEAAALLGVKLPTLYAYVSRRLVRSAPGQQGRARRYVRADLERLRARRGARAGLTAGAAGALHWGEPVLESSISRLTQAGPVYRERSALELADAGASFEAVAELLWSGSLPPGRPRWQSDGLGVPAVRLASLLPPGSSPLAALSLLLPALAARDPARFDARPEAVLARARGLIRRLAAGLALGIEPERSARALEAGSVAGAVVRALGGRGGAAAVRAVDRALVISADHELNASTFAARVTASTRADVFACVSAALAALSGPWHGAVTDRVEALVAEAEQPERARRVVHE